MEVLDFYGDESCCDGNNQFLVIGGIAVRGDFVQTIADRLHMVRDRYPKISNAEVKWSKTSNAALRFFKEYSDVFFDAASKGEANFTGLYVDKKTFDHRTYNQGEPDIGFSKMVYQLLLHKVGIRWGRDYRITVKLDERESVDHPDTLRPMLNHDLRRKGINTDPFRRIEHRDSKKSDLIQLNDLLIGALAANHNPQDGRAKHKLALAAHVIARAKQTCSPYSIYGWNATTFKVWEFRFKKK